jgi:hypothetical protein
MTTKRPLTAAERAIAKRLKSIIASNPDLTEEAVGVHVGVSQGMVSHWTGGRNPVPARRAAKLAEALGIEYPGEISLEYRQINPPRHQGVAEPQPIYDPAPPSDELAALRAEVDAQRALLAVMVTVTAAHRPVEGADLARRLRKHVHSKHLQVGFVRDLLQTLDKLAAPADRPAKHPADPRQSGSTTR